MKLAGTMNELTMASAMTRDGLPTKAAKLRPKRPAAARKTVVISESEGSEAESDLELDDADRYILSCLRAQVHLLNSMANACYAT